MGTFDARKGVRLMEIFGIPVVFTLRDIISLSGVVIALFLMAAALVIMIPIELARKYMEWRNRKFYE